MLLGGESARLSADSRWNLSPGQARLLSHSSASCRIPSASLTKCRPHRKNQPLRALSHSSFNSPGFISEVDLDYLQQSVQHAAQPTGITQPHPFAGCLVVGLDGRVLASAHQRAQGTTSAEVQALTSAGAGARGSTVYLNLESGNCHGDDTAIEALMASGVSRVVLGMRHPLSHLRGKAIYALRAKGVGVDVLGESLCMSEGVAEQVPSVLDSCLEVNEALLHRAVLQRPLSILKYAMTLDGKIATSMGHSAWVSSPQSRAVVFETRAQSDAVIVGGNTVRRDNPRLTTRREGGHTPARLVMTRTLDLPEDANIWDVSVAPTIVLTQRGARTAFQAQLRRRGVEVVEFDFLTPENVADYCYQRGFLQCFWECGGTLAAPTIASGVIHKVMAFVAPKIIGGVRAPTPVGDLGFVEMTQAVNLTETRWRQVGPDLLMMGYLPSSGGPRTLAAALGKRGGDVGQPQAVPASYNGNGTGRTAGGSMLSAEAATIAGRLAAPLRRRSRQVAMFYKAWDQWGALSNFSPHPIRMPSAVAGPNGETTLREWCSVEHYYQATKFAGVAHPDAVEAVEAIASAESPEEAARIGRRLERFRPELMRQDWVAVKTDVMYQALRAKFSAHEGPREMLMSTAPQDEEASELVENSPHDFFWGQGWDGSGLNNLGRLLMQLRSDMVAEREAARKAGVASLQPR